MARALRSFRQVSCPSVSLPSAPLAIQPQAHSVAPCRCLASLARHKPVACALGSTIGRAQRPQKREFFNWFRGGGSSGSNDGSGKKGKDGEDLKAAESGGNATDVEAIRGSTKEAAGASSEEATTGAAAVAASEAAAKESPAEAAVGELVPVGGGSAQKVKDIMGGGGDGDGGGDSPMLALPLATRPLFPGQQQLLQISHPEVIKKVTEMLKHKNPIVSVFLRRDEESAAAASSAASSSGPLSSAGTSSWKLAAPSSGSSSSSSTAGHGRRRRRMKLPDAEEVVHIELEKPRGSDDLLGEAALAGRADPLEAFYHVGTRARITQAGQFGAASQGSGGNGNSFHSPGGGLRNPQEGLTLLLFGHDLVKLEKVLDPGPPAMVKVSRLKPKKAAVDEENPDELKAHISEAKHVIREIMKVNPQFREHMGVIHKGVERLEKGDPNAIAHFAASLTTASGEHLMQVLEEVEPLAKLQKALVLLKKELELSQLQQKISQQIDEKVSGHQREFLLREQLKMLKKELGEEKDPAKQLEGKFLQQLEGKIVPKEAKEVIDSEMEKLSSLAKESQEYQVTRNYLDWLTLLPWGIHSEETLSLLKAKTILDRDHYGLADVKQRILELIAVGQLRGSVQGKIICFVGPPGVGKTSIGRSIAEALGREYHRFSVGGLYDVAEIKGHRRTYVGAMPGKVVQCLKKVQTQNPLILIDEIDKLGRGHAGDPASALLELLDPSQNSGFLDHYLDLPLDCSKVLFVCTANVTHTIPGPLLDRMEVIRLSGYDQREKLAIAEDYLVPVALRDVGLWAPVAAPPPLPDDASATGSSSSSLAGRAAQEENTNSSAIEAVSSSTAEVSTPNADHAPASADLREKLSLPPAAPLPINHSQEDSSTAPTLGAAPDAAISRGALESLIRWYCRESGVRNLQKHIEKIGRKLAMRVVQRREAALDGAAEGEEAVAPPSTKPAAADQESVAELQVTDENLSVFVGKALFTSDRLYEGETPPGTVMGLAWTSLGGSALYVEATAIPRAQAAKVAPSVQVTGQLGDVMKESARIALLVARRHLQLQRTVADSARDSCSSTSSDNSAASETPEEGLCAAGSCFFEEHELHLHCPEGATPKDGPSAGVTIVTSLLSLSFDRAVRQDLAMTGEVSLNGKVLPVGGIKEKTIAARRAGCKTLVFPQANQRDFDELPAYLKEGLEVHYATEYPDVLRVAFPEECVSV